MENTEHKSGAHVRREEGLEWHRVVRLGLNEMVIFEQSLKEMMKLARWILERGAFQAAGIATVVTKQACAWFYFRKSQKPRG